MPVAKHLMRRTPSQTCETWMLSFRKPRRGKDNSCYLMCRSIGDMSADMYGCRTVCGTARARQSLPPFTVCFFAGCLRRKSRPRLTDIDIFIWRSSSALKRRWRRWENQHRRGTVHLQRGGLIPATFDVPAGTPCSGSEGVTVWGGEWCLALPANYKWGPRRSPVPSLANIPVSSLLIWENKRASLVL